jgi:cytochrome c biogenesis protein CcmG, thiol:disulfide interchange protein DsbE
MNLSATTRTRLIAFGALIAAAGLIALLFFGLSTRGADAELRNTLEERRAFAAPGFELAVLDEGDLPPRLFRRLGLAIADGEVSLDELRGVPVVLNFWASWCDPCRSEAPILERAWRRDGRRGVLYVGLDMQDLTGDAEAFLEEFGITYPTVRDPGRAVADGYGLTGIPETAFIDRDGRVVAYAIGALEPHLLEIGVEAAREGRVAGILSGGAQLEPR